MRFGVRAKLQAVRGGTTGHPPDVVNRDRRVDDQNWC